jgi:general secretion pathway protein G
MEKKTLNEIARKAKEGFTLIEILVVVAIIGMLGAVAVPAYMNYLADARITTTRSLIKNIEDACQMYNMKHGGKYPSQLSELQEGDDDNPPLIDGGLEDPWRNEIKYEKKGKRIYLTSFGPDGEEGTDDDITNLDKKKSK